MLKINNIVIEDGDIQGITIINNKCYVNGKEYNINDYSNEKIVNIEVQGNVNGDIKTNGTVSITGSCKNIETNGVVNIGGNCENIDTNGSVTCYGDINGDIDANGNVSLRRK